MRFALHLLHNQRCSLGFRRDVKHLDPGPLERDDIYKAFCDVRIATDEMESEVKGKYRWVEDVRRGLGES